VFEEPQLNVDVRVNEDGTIRLPLVGNVPAEGLTENQLAARLKKTLESSLLQRASVSVEVLEFRSRPISVIGAVKKPGNLDLSGRLTLLEALTAAGGLAENHGNTVNVLRRAENGLTDQVSISVDELLVQANPDVNIPIFANDLINVPAAVDLTVYCLGEVTTPGAYSFRSTERVTLLAVIARAGGLTDRASKKILIKRPQPDGTAKEIVVHYKRIISGQDPDVELEQGDVIVVKESFF
jgi:polysaccharide export outer membrane protein